MSYVVFGIVIVLQPGEWTFGKTAPPRGQQQTPTYRAEVVCTTSAMSVYDLRLCLN